MPSLFQFSIAVLCGAIVAPQLIRAAEPVDIDDVPLKATPVGKPQDRIGAGARGEKKEGEPEIFLVAPQQTLGTASTQPTFYWYLTAKTDADIEFVITEAQDAQHPVMKKSYEGDEKPGLHSTSLAAEKITLKPGVQYRATILLKSGSDPSEYPFSTGFVEVIPRPEGLPPQPDGPACAAAGLWYEAIDTLARKAAESPNDSKPMRELKGLLWKQHVFYTLPRGKSDPAEQERAQKKEIELLNHFAAGAGAPSSK